jgi:copper chaperone
LQILKEEERMSDKVVIKIEGMTCGHCVMSVSRALKRVVGVADVNISLGEKQAVVVHTGADPDALKEAVENAGYDVVSLA